MSSAIEQFVIELARSRAPAQKFLRGLNREDADDVLAQAVLFAWEHRAEYTNDVAPAQWFSRFLSQARRAFKPHGPMTRSLDELTAARGVDRLADLASSADTARESEVRSAAEGLLAAFDADERRVLRLRSAGHSVKETAELTGFPRAHVMRVMARARRYRDVLPELAPAERTRRHVTAGEHDPEKREPAAIDAEIERILQRPRTERADCPPCWRCMWYDALRGSGHVTEVDMRKDSIAESVSNGSIGFTGVASR